MNDREIFFIRGILIIIGLLFFLYGTYMLYNDLSERLFLEESVFLSTEGLLPIFILLIIGFSFYFIGRRWTYSLKYLANFFVFFAVFFLFISFFLFAINSNSEEIAQSIQPSIDYIAASSIDMILNDMLEIDYGAEFDLLLYDNFEIKDVYVRNLSIDDANFFLGNLEIEIDNNEEKIEYSKILISMIYNSLNQYGGLDTAISIPISSIKKQFQNSGISLNEIVEIPPEDIKLVFPINNDASLNFIVGNNTVKKTFVVGEISEDNIELIWKNLNFEERVSFETKEKVINIILSQISNFVPNADLLSNFEIPIASLTASIPQSYLSIFSYDIFSPDLNVRSNQIADMREDCTQDILNFSELCDAIAITEYSTFLNSIISSEDINPEFAQSNLELIENLNTIEKVEEYIYEKTSSWKKYLFMYFFLIFLAFVSYYLNFKLFGRELINIHIPYYISKINLYYTLPNFIFVFLIYYFFSIEKIFEFLNNFQNGNIPEELFVALANLPVFQIIPNLLQSIFIYSLVYFIISFSLFIFLRYLLNKKLSQY